MKLLNNICEKEAIGGTYKNGGVDNIFDPTIEPSETYYWDDERTSREGIRVILPKIMSITRIELYSTDRYPLHTVKFELDGEVIHEQDIVSRSSPMIFEGEVIGKVLEIVRYTVYDSVISKINIYGKDAVYCMYKNGERFIYEGDIKLVLNTNENLKEKGLNLENVQNQYLEKEKEENIKIIKYAFS